MSQNPYQPPKAELSNAPMPSHAPTQLQYAGFWRRFFAYLIDALIFVPLGGINYLLSDKTHLFYAYWLVPGLAISLLFHVYLVKRYGGTPGKLALKTRIALVDGSPVTLKAAALRHAVLFVLSALGSIALVMGSMAMTEQAYLSMGYFARTQELVRLMPPWYQTVTVLTQIWVWGEFISMLFNKRRRAIHDYIAGTVVVRSV